MDELVHPAYDLVQRAGGRLVGRMPDTGTRWILARGAVAVGMTILAMLAGLLALALWIAAALVAFTLVLLFWWLPLFGLNWLVSATSYRVTVDRNR